MAVFRSLSAPGCIMALLLHSIPPSSNSDEVWAMYESWLARQGKSHSSLGQKQMRFGVFADNLRFIDEHNGKTDVIYRLGLNRFADLPNVEYRRTYLGGRKIGERYRVAEDEGAEAGIKDQGNCKSGWALSVIAAAEGINKIVTGDLITLSEQELVDCETMFHDGCNVCLMDHAYEFIINNGGVVTDEQWRSHRHSSGVN